MTESEEDDEVFRRAAVIFLGALLTTPKDFEYRMQMLEHTIKL